ncbi:MAG: polysaccharide deacetylase family protein [Solirubrobacterales bacterium]
MNKKAAAVIGILIVIIIGISGAYYISLKKQPIVNAVQTNGDKTMDTRETQADQEVKQHLSEQMEVLNIYKSDGNKTAYLTFDDGPSPDVTPEILAVLNKNKINASFFVIGNLAEKRADLVKEEAAEGNKIYNHTYSHVYKNIYTSPQSFIDDVNKCDEVLKNILGSTYKSKIIRFPGGSFGNKLGPYRDAISKAGYAYIDWNALNGDAESSNPSSEKLIQRLKETAKGEHIVVLMHDATGKQCTARALQQIIDYLKAEGYTFKTL